MSVLELAIGQNNEGYHHALLKAWENCGCKIETTPTKSSLSEMREKVAYHFFEDIFRQNLEMSEPRRWRGYYVYATDGDQLDLPASQDVLDHGYRGYPTSHNRETHYPKMYTTQVYDVLNEQVREFSFSSQQDEVHLARELVPALEKESISIYDRLHCGYETMYTHIKYGSCFLIRARINDGGEAGRGVNEQVAKFLKSNKKETIITWRPPLGFRRQKPDLKMRAIKIKHPKTKRIYVFLTNLAPAFGRKAIAQLYRRRWEIETSFRDLTCTLKMNQWHSTKLNGILQEIYALLWIVNSAKRQMLKIVKPKELLKRLYERTNFKLTIRCIMSNLRLLISNKLNQFYTKLEIWMSRMVERRKRDSRSYERVVKHRGREYMMANTVKRRIKPLTERH